MRRTVGSIERQCRSREVVQRHFLAPLRAKKWVSKDRGPRNERGSSRVVKHECGLRHEAWGVVERGAKRMGEKIN